MENQQKIEAYIGRFPDWRGEKLKELRDIINRAAPDSTEDYKWDCPVWSQNGLLLAISGFKGRIKINFFHGADFPDQSHFNNGLDSKDHRSIDFKEADKIDAKTIANLVAVDIQKK